MASCNNYNTIMNCTLEICCREQGFVHYEPDLPATVAYLAIFALLALIQLGLGIWAKTWGFTVGMVCGLILEVLGYAGRIAIRQDPFNISIFLFYFIPLGLGPAFLTASIYLTLGRLVIIYSPSLSRLKPRTYTLGFVTVDILSICIQAVGGGICGSAMTDEFRQKGVNILITGLSLQAASLATFLVLCCEYAWRVKHAEKAEREDKFEALRERRRFRWFLAAITIAAATIFIRCIYRVIELAQGFGGAIANAEVPFLILEGPMIMIAALCLTVLHPGIVFRGAKNDVGEREQSFWAASEWKLRTPKEEKEDADFTKPVNEAMTAEKKSKSWRVFGFGGSKKDGVVSNAQESIVQSEGMGSEVRIGGPREYRVGSDSTLESATTAVGHSADDGKMVEVN